MKSIIRRVLFASALVIPVASFAQSTEHTTRAQVRAELVQLESVGWHVGDGDTTHYPDEVQAAEAKVAARDASTSNYGGASITSRVGGSVSAEDWNAMYSR
ncbi:uncharacterized protein DUF4148 [Paraburkholderia sp. BL6665CI2N2]|uniref:DUF4148 domain-containing protein n=1 Tax=Paraburkholderia sp. BL6665CI2N2 TaxID=1938806 RepID=UPI001064ECC2|nr:DUF4148 domain-containing protein [Paraburkholderia sp. BL6665CI2N2]TDY22512.1 uncharacterized protein DUF4148 [Paraburkholderia sp. BL6665CI2N2]